MALKLDTITHFDIIFTVIQSFLELPTFQFLQNMKAAIYEYGLLHFEWEASSNSLQPLANY